MLKIANKNLLSRLFLGTGKFPSDEIMRKCIEESCCEVVTVSMRRMDFSQNSRDQILQSIPDNIILMPNTSGARTAEEAILYAELSREVLGVNWIKIEVIPDPHYLLPDPVETLKASDELVRKGFVVLPYINADPVLAKKLEDVGVSAVMPLGSPIGTNRGIQTKEMIEIIIEQAGVPVVIDAGLGRPSDAAQAMEMGADAVLVNTAIAISNDPVLMAKAFKTATDSGRWAFECGMPGQNKKAQASSPLTGFLNV
ncbi:MAG: thiazole synthase [Epsilonproteobacteria bacterium]|nr:MAG: thiazole synthase [Campylobacterota bacterium]RLA67687.1 MAG: thiazole synthase [Campylobacterota bacterium]